MADDDPEYDYTLTARWSKKEKDLIFNSPNGPDGHLLYGWLCHQRPTYFSDMMSRLEGGKIPIEAFYDAQGKTLAEELESRGYDITTLRFSIKRKKQVP